MLCNTNVILHRHRMKRLLTKYFRSVLTPDEFDRFCDYVEKPENTFSISGMMKAEWNQSLAGHNRRKNPELLKHIRQTILKEEKEKTTKKLKIYSVGLRIAAVLLIGLIATSVWFYQQSRLVIENMPTQTVSIPEGARTRLEMPDGSMVWLNSGSRITYSGDFSKERKVELVGEAFFDVVKNKIPFEVNTSYGKVKVLGTAFNVQAYEDGNFVTTLERGLVKVTDRDNMEQEVVKPGEQVRFVRDSFIKKKVDIKLYTSWKEGKLIFSREPFPGMIKRLERWFNVKIEFSDRDFEDLWFSGVIEGETVTGVMEMICKAAPVGYTYNSRERTVKITSKIRD